MIGTLASILAKGNFLPEGTLILSLARNPKENSKDITKISLRLASLRPYQNNQNADLRRVLQDIVSRVGGETGGHQFAAGGLIDTVKENVFIEAAKEILGDIKN